MMQRSKRILNWENFTWRRPSEIYSLPKKRKGYKHLPKKAHKDRGVLSSRASNMGSLVSYRANSTSKMRLNASKASIGTVSKLEKFEPNYFLFNDIKPDDIKQGHCGNCYFLSCLSSMAEFPDRIMKIFLQQDVQESGLYAM